MRSLGETSSLATTRPPYSFIIRFGSFPLAPTLPLDVSIHQISFEKRKFRQFGVEGRRQARVHPRDAPSEWPSFVVDLFEGWLRWFSRITSHPEKRMTRRRCSSCEHRGHCCWCHDGLFRKREFLPCVCIGVEGHYQSQDLEDCRISAFIIQSLSMSMESPRFRSKSNSV